MESVLFSDFLSISDKICLTWLEDNETIPYHQVRKQSKLHLARMYEAMVYLAIIREHAIGAVAIGRQCKTIEAGLITAGLPSCIDLFMFRVDLDTKQAKEPRGKGSTSKHIVGAF